ncbi:MAG TPA: glycosyl transferase, partial [Porphyromonadaceae bacterium]|nr:glycosyl transferase [Porphyromonadaceae bacterium]
MSSPIVNPDSARRVVVLVPCYNEAITIGKVVGDVRRVLPEAQVYVYDNNSTDDTARLAREAGAIVVSEPRQGKGNVLRSMFRDVDADCYLLIDGDDTYGVDALPEMARMVLEQRVDMVVGDRLSSTYLQVNNRRYHNFGNLLVRGLINRMF